MSIAGPFFNNQTLTAEALGAFGAAAVGDGILQGCSVAVNGTAVTVDVGHVILGGRVAQIIAAESLTLTESTGYARILGNIDLTAAATTSEFAQVSLSLDYASSMSGFAALTQNDINGGGGTAYTGVLAVIALGATPTVEAKKASGGGLVKLWENPSPTAAFAVDSVLAIPSIAGFEGLCIKALQSNGSYTGIISRSFPLEGMGDVIVNLDSYSINNSNSTAVFIRKLTINRSNGTITFTKSWNNTGGAVSGANALIPQAIYGFHVR